jgi:crotonobetainyl-CoA:carnitine CoA-transferase CaiB-like acyl-CoA transferase
MAEVGMFPEFDHPSEGKIVLSGVPVTFSKSPGAIRRMAPKIGEQGSEILTEIGYDDDRIADLRNTGALIETTD